MSDHERYRELAAGFVLGVLDPEERRGFERHLGACEDCRNEVASFAPIPGLLATVDSPDADPLPARVVDRAAARARSDWRSMDLSRRRWRWAAAVAALVAAVVAAVAVVPSGGGPEQTVLAVQSAEVDGEVAIGGRPWGTAVHLELEGLPQRDRYVAWVIDDEGERQQAATWGPTAAGVALVDGASSIPIDRVVSVVVTDADGAEALATALAP